MANTLLNSGSDAAAALIIAREALFHLENNLVAAARVHRAYKREFVKKGDTVTIRKPVKFVVSDGATRVNQDVTEQSTTLTIDQRKHVSWKWSSQDLTLTITQFAERFLKGGMIPLANVVDAAVLGLYKDLYWRSGTPGTTPGSFKAVGQIGAVLKDHSVPMDSLSLMINSDAELEIADGLKGVFNPGMAKSIIEKGFVGRVSDFSLFHDQNVARHTTGVFSASAVPLVDGAAQTGSSLLTKGWDAGNNTVKAGDQFTLAGVNSVNPVSYVDTGKLQTFTITADGTSAAGALTLAIAPAITITGPYQTVTAAAGDSAVITMVGTEATTYPQNLALHKNALALVTVPLELPGSVPFKARVNHRGVSIRLLKDFDIDADDEIVRLDVMYGLKAIYREIGGRLWG